MEGQVVEGGIPIAGATIILLSLPDTVFVSYTIANQDGAFTMLVPTEGGYLFKVSSIGYQAKFVPVPSSFELGKVTIDLDPATEQLQQINVRAITPMKVRGDTIVYRGAAFRDSTERKVRDLLVKLPGVEVNESGDVKVRGRAIRTMLIDGDNVLDRNYQLLTNNLSADVVENIEVYFDYFDNPLLSTIYDSRVIAVNLVTAQDKRRKINAEFTAGYGSEHRYDLDGSSVALYDKFKNISFATAGNVGRPLQSANRQPLPETDFPIPGMLRPSPERLLPFPRLTGRPDQARINETHLLSTVLTYRPRPDWKMAVNLTLPGEKYLRDQRTTFDYADDSPSISRAQMETGRNRLSHASVQLIKDSPGKSRFLVAGSLLTTSQDRVVRLSRMGVDRRSNEYRAGSLRLQLTQRLSNTSLAVFDAVYQKEEEKLDLRFTGPEGAIIVDVDGTRRDTFRQEQRYQPRTIHVGGRLLKRAGKAKIVAAFGVNHRETGLGLVTQSEEDFGFARSELYAEVQASRSLTRTIDARGFIQGGFTKTIDAVNSRPSEPFYKGNVALFREWNLLKRVEVSYDIGNQAPSELLNVAAFRLQTRFAGVRGTRNIVNTFGRSRKLTLEAGTGKVIPYQSIVLRGAIENNRDNYLPSYDFAGATSLVTYLAQGRRRDAREVSLTGEYLLTLISSTIKFDTRYGKEDYVALVEQRQETFSRVFTDWNISARTGFDLPINLVLGVERTVSRTYLQSASEERFTAATTVPYLDVRLKLRRFLAKWTSDWQYFEAPGLRTDNLISNLELSYQPGNVVTNIQMTVYNIADVSSIARIQSFEFGQVSNEAIILPRYVLFTVSLSF